MFINASKPDFVDAVRREAARARALADDLDLIASGQAPTAEMLSAAPIIGDYVLGMDQIPCLFGRVTGHPYLRGPTSVTSRLVVIDPRGGWARTLSRFYRLGGSGAVPTSPYDAD